MTTNLTESYIQSLLPEGSEPIQRIENYAEEHGIPIMEKIGIRFLQQLIMIQKPKKVLEIGTAIGYSAIKIVQAYPETIVVTIERDEERCRVAKENIEKLSHKNHIQLLSGNALELVNEIKNFGPYDFLFIDAAKGQYEKLFNIYEPLVNVGGLIVSDNVLFKGIVAGERQAPTKKVAQLVKKIQHFNETVMNDPRFESMIYPIGDGIMVSYKKGE